MHRYYLYMIRPAVRRCPIQWVYSYNADSVPQHMLDAQQRLEYVSGIIAIIGKE